jgi:hypothetical protein
MNILNDFIIRVDTAVPETGKEQEIAHLTSIINEKDELIAKYSAELERLNSGIIVQEPQITKKVLPKRKYTKRGRPSGKIKESVKLASIVQKSEISTGTEGKRRNKKTKTREK